MLRPERSMDAMVVFLGGWVRSVQGRARMRGTFGPRVEWDSESKSSSRRILHRREAILASTGATKRERGRLDRAEPRGNTEMAKTGNGHPHIDARSLAMAKIIVKRTRRRSDAHRGRASQPRERGATPRAAPPGKQGVERRSCPGPGLKCPRDVLLEESDEGQRLRSSKPCAGFVTEEERLEIFRRFPPSLAAHVPYAPRRGPGRADDKRF